MSRMLHDVGLLLIRAMVGWVFVFHGAQKLFAAFGGDGMGPFIENVAGLGVPLPAVSAYFAACAEFFGGSLLILGLATRVAAVPVVITMAVAVFAVHAHAFSLQAKGMEYALTLGVVTLGLFFTGPGRLSIDAMFPGASGRLLRGGRKKDAAK